MARSVVEIHRTIHLGLDRFDHQTRCTDESLDIPFHQSLDSTLSRDSQTGHEKERTVSRFLREECPRILRQVSSSPPHHSLRKIKHLFPIRQEHCLVNHGTLLEYFLLELIQIEHADIRQRLASKSTGENTSSTSDDDSSEQKSRLSKVIDEIEQCIYCLYGLVLRKSKMKYLNDHNCRPVSVVTGWITSTIFVAVGIDTGQSEYCLLCVTTETVAWLRGSCLDHHQRSNDRSHDRKRIVLFIFFADGESVSTLWSDDRMERWARTTTNVALSSHRRCRIDWQRRTAEWSPETSLRCTISIPSCVTTFLRATLHLVLVLVSTRKISTTCSLIITWKWLRKMQPVMNRRKSQNETPTFSPSSLFECV